MHVHRAYRRFATALVVVTLSVVAYSAAWTPGVPGSKLLVAKSLDYFEPFAPYTEPMPDAQRTSDPVTLASVASLAGPSLREHHRLASTVVVGTVTQSDVIDENGLRVVTSLIVVSQQLKGETVAHLTVRQITPYFDQTSSPRPANLDPGTEVLAFCDRSSIDSGAYYPVYGSYGMFRIDRGKNLVERTSDAGCEIVPIGELSAALDTISYTN